MLKIAFSEFTLLREPNSLPSLYENYAKHAALSDWFESEDT